VGETTGAWALSDAGERLTAVRSWSVLPGLIRFRAGWSARRVLRSVRVDS
jgi:hypothetical protein